VGTLNLPASGLVYLDASPLIYTVEKHPVYGPLLQPVWLAAQAKTFDVASSELVLLLILPLKNSDKTLEQAYELALLGTDMHRSLSCVGRHTCGPRPSSRRPTRCTPPRLWRWAVRCSSAMILASAPFQISLW
jgi:hypothetical protein